MDIQKTITTSMQKTAEAIIEASKRLDSQIVDVVDLLFCTRGRVVITGVGKSALVGRKIASTLCSTGTSAQFLHSSDALHGDLGLLSKEDVVVAISYSGASQEINPIIPYIKQLGLKLVALTGDKKSILAVASDFVIDCQVAKSSEIFGLVPTASTSVVLAVGDAIAIALSQKRGFKLADFAKMHPGGTIGQKLLLKVKHLMKTGKAIPIVKVNFSITEAIEEMTKKSLGSVIVVDEKGKLEGIFTDGDLRRTICRPNWQGLKIGRVSSGKPKSILKTSLAIEALEFMELNKIMMLPVIDEKKSVIGIIHMHALLEAGLV